MSNKPLPKSLHTVTVIVRVARLVMRTERLLTVAAVDEALDALGYSGAADPYGLRDAAIKQMSA